MTPSFTLLPSAGYTPPSIASNAESLLELNPESMVGEFHNFLDADTQAPEGDDDAVLWQADIGTAETSASEAQNAIQLTMLMMEHLNTAEGEAFQAALSEVVQQADDNVQTAEEILATVNRILVEQSANALLHKAHLESSQKQAAQSNPWRALPQLSTPSNAISTENPLPIEQIANELKAKTEQDKGQWQQFQPRVDPRSLDTMRQNAANSRANLQWAELVALAVNTADASNASTEPTAQTDLLLPTSLSAPTKSTTQLIPELNTNSHSWQQGTNSWSDLSVAHRTSPASASHASFQLNVPVENPMWAATFAERMAWSVREGLSKLQIRLDPPELGPMDVELSLDGTEVRIEFQVMHGSVRSAVESSLDQLRELLSSAGYNLVRSDVSEHKQNQPGQTWSEQLSHQSGKLLEQAPQQTTQKRPLRPGGLDEYA